MQFPDLLYHPTATLVKNIFGMAGALAGACAAVATGTAVASAGPTAGIGAVVAGVVAAACGIYAAGSAAVAAAVDLLNTNGKGFKIVVGTFRIGGAPSGYVTPR